MSFIDGRGIVQGPAKPVVTTPEQEAHAAAKLAKAREARAQRKRQQAAGVSVEPEVIETTGATPEPSEGVDQSPSTERKRMPWQSDGEAEHGPRLPDMSKWPKHPETGAPMSPKLYARMVQDQQEREASERGDFAPTSKAAYLHALASDDEYQAAQRAYEQADASLKALLTEQAAFMGKMQDAIEQQDLDQIKTLRERQRELPDLIFAARMGASTLKLTYYQLRAARVRVAKQEARAAASKVNADFQEWQRKVNEATNAALTASYESDDAVRDVGAVMRELDQLKAEALAAAIGPQAHRAPVGMVEYGADTSYMSPMPVPGLKRPE